MKKFFIIIYLLFIIYKIVKILISLIKSFNTKTITKFYKYS